MASDDESVATNFDVPPRLTKKDKKARTSELEFVFRTEVRSLNAISRRVITACLDEDSILVDLEDVIGKGYSSTVYRAID